MSSVPAAGAVASGATSAMRAPVPFALNPLSDELGAELVGVDLAQPLSAEGRAALLEALEERHVLVARGQHVDDAALRTLAAAIGSIERHYVLNADGSAMNPVHLVSNLGEDGKPSQKPFQNSNFHWHTDKSYRAAPTFVTILAAVELPPDGGETQFANLIAAHAALPDDVKRAIAPLQVVHSLEFMRRTLDERPLTDAERRASPPVTHPLVCTNPRTGAKSLYLGIYASHVAGMPEAESRALLDRLTQHATQPAFVLDHRWRLGDVVIWDNRWLLHRAVTNFEMEKHRRIMRRVVVEGSPPR